jgi:hypothetical protein
MYVCKHVYIRSEVRLTIRFSGTGRYEFHMADFFSGYDDIEHGDIPDARLHGPDCPPIEMVGEN